MARYAIHASGFFMPSGFKPAGYLVVEDATLGHYSAETPSGIEVRELGDVWVAPGLVDMHIHGFMGDDMMDLEEAKLDAMCAAMPSTGSTTWFPTTLTAPEDDLTRACKIIGEHVDKPGWTKVAGVFLEGPWFSPAYKGAQNPAYMKDPDKHVFDLWMEALQGKQMKIAIAPERKDAPEFCAYATKLGAVVALAHSNATYEEATACIDAGASVFVHTYNGMSGLHHRKPGMVGAALTSDAYCEIICDGHHVTPAAAHVVMQGAGLDKTCLITDAMRAAGMPDGEYLLGELPVIVQEGTARLTDSGSLAGSILELKYAVKNVVDWGLVTPAQAIAMASINPARAAHVDDECGSLTAGHAADITVFDKQMNLLVTIIDGEVVWEA